MWSKNAQRSEMPVGSSGGWGGKVSPNKVNLWECCSIVLGVKVFQRWLNAFSRSWDSTCRCCPVGNVWKGKDFQLQHCLGTDLHGICSINVCVKENGANEDLINCQPWWLVGASKRGCLFGKMVVFYTILGWTHWQGWQPGWQEQSTGGEWDWVGISVTDGTEPFLWDTWYCPCSSSVCQMEVWR